MTKNKMMRIASVLLVAVLLTTCAISGTFAKYTSSAEATDSARVAKWGWGTTSITVDLFQSTYTNVAAGEDVIAPGTSYTAALVYAPASTFTPEVAYKLTFTATATIPTEIEDQLNWTLAVDDAATSEYYTFNDLVAALEAIEYTVDVGAAAPTVDVEIGWVWAFEDGSDTEDTYLGDNWSTNSLDVTVKMTATQRD